MRKKYAEIEIDTARCNGCGMCVAVCPCNVLAVKAVEGKPKAVTVWSVKCDGCGHCSAVCMRGAVGIETFRLDPAF